MLNLWLLITENYKLWRFAGDFQSVYVQEKRAENRSWRTTEAAMEFIKCWQ